jgi:hypothetical protein
MIELKKCRKCGYQFLSRGKKCPNCGAPANSVLKKILKILALVLLLFIAIDKVTSLIIVHVFNPETKDKVDKMKPSKHYNRLKGLLKDQRYMEAIREIEWFRSHNRTDYKEVALFVKVLEERLVNQVKKIPVEKTEKNYTIYDLLCRLEPDNDHYQNKKSFYQNRLNN